MFNTLIGTLTALMVMGNVTGFHLTSWWGIATMYFGCALLRNAALVAISRGQEINEAKKEEESNREEIDKVIVALKEAAEQTKRINDDDEKKIH